jgi:molybdate transport system substrate-binding protein
MIGRHLPAALVLALSTCIACTAKQTPGETVVVFAAASLSDSFRALEQAYEATHPDIDVVINLAGSQLLATQVLEGAPVDVFASADAATLDRVLAERPALPNTRQGFASNRLVIVVPSESPFHDFADFEDFEFDFFFESSRRSAKVVLAGPEVPLGRYTREVLDQLGLRDVFEAKLVSNEDSVDGVLAKLELGECDVGIAYATDLRRSNRLRGIPLPDSVDVVARYELAVLADGPAPENGQAFATFVTGDKGQALLREHGFGPIMLGE